MWWFSLGVCGAQPLRARGLGALGLGILRLSIEEGKCGRIAVSRYLLNGYGQVSGLQEFRVNLSLQCMGF